MSKTRLVLAAVVLSLSFASPSSACLKWPWPSVIAWTVSATGAGLGGMFIWYQIQSNNAYAASFNPSTLVVTGYQSLQQQCASCFNDATVSCTYYPYTATYLANFKVTAGNTTQIYNTTGLSMMYPDIFAKRSCGNSANEAIVAMKSRVSIGASAGMWYQNDKPSSWTFKIIAPSNGYTAGIAVSAAVFAIAGAIGGFLFCLTAPPTDQYVTQEDI